MINRASDCMIFVFRHVMFIVKHLLRRNVCCTNVPTCKIPNSLLACVHSYWWFILGAIYKKAYLYLPYLWIFFSSWTQALPVNLSSHQPVLPCGTRVYLISSLRLGYGILFHQTPSFGSHSLTLVCRLPLRRIRCKGQLVPFAEPDVCYILR